MTMCDAEAVQELAAALYQPCEVVLEDTGISGGEVFVEGPDGCLPEFVTLPCHVVKLGVDEHGFKDHVAAMIYLRVLGVRGDE